LHDVYAHTRMSSSTTIVSHPSPVSSPPATSPPLSPPHRSSFTGSAPVPRSALFPWNEPAHANVWHCTLLTRVRLTSDRTYSDVHAAVRQRTGAMRQGRSRCFSMSVTSSGLASGHLRPEPAT